MISAPHAEIIAYQPRNTCRFLLTIALAPVAQSAALSSASGNGGPVVDRGTSAGNRYGNRC
jgi:hypothetical protein